MAETSEGTGLPASAEPAPALPPPRPRFARPFFFWLFVISVPLAVVAEAVGIYVHEFAHGLAALATGGHFLGVRGQLTVRGSPAAAYADAWSEGWDGLVLMAGLATGVVLGVLSFWRGRRARGIFPRLILLVFASNFLGEFSYAAEGCLFAGSASFDTSLLVQELGSSVARWGGFGIFLGAMSVSSFVVGRAQLRVWEEVFGALSAGRAFWVILLLVCPVRVLGLRVPGGWVGALISLAIFIAVAVALIRGRRRDVAPAPLGRIGLWGGAIWAGGIAAAVALAYLEQGIPVGSYSQRFPLDLRLKERSVAGFLARYGMAESLAGDRPVQEAKLFVSTPEGCRVFPSPSRDVMDVVWLPEERRLLAVTERELCEVDPESGQSKVLWKPERGSIKKSSRGPDGQLLLVVEHIAWPSFHETRFLYVHDSRSGWGEPHEAPGAVGNPFFVPGPGARAWVTVGRDLWEFAWEEKVTLTRHGGASSEGWLEGYSGAAAWWGDGEGWRSGETRIKNEDFALWGIGAEGFFAVRKGGTWQLVAPDGSRRTGPLDSRSVELLGFPDGAPWVVLRDGSVWRVGDASPSFRVKLPEAGE